MAHSSATDSISKRQKLSDEEAKLNNTTIDRISSLPDPLLCHILSFLPTKLAVATSILSTRWKNQWALVPSLDFDDDGDRVRYMNFVHFVYRVLLLRDKASAIRKFRLKCDTECGSFPINAWVSAALTRAVEELDLVMFPGESVELPRRLFTCKTLVVLKMNSKIVLNVPSSVYLPSLRILHLHCVDCGNSKYPKMLISGCPILEELLMVGFCFYKGGVFNIHAPALKNLTLDYVIRYPGVTISIETQSSLVEAHIRVCGGRGAEEPDEYYGDSAFQFLTGLYNVKYLFLNGKTVETLKYASSYNLPIFHNLTQLEMDIRGCNWHLLPNLLESSPNLEVLSLKKDFFYRSENVCWRHPQLVPKCISLHLAKVTMSEFEGLKGELKFVRYILENGKVLDTINIRCPRLNLRGKTLLLKTISMFPQGSETCQVTIY